MYEKLKIVLFVGEERDCIDAIKTLVRADPTRYMNAMQVTTALEEHDYYTTIPEKMFDDCIRSFRVVSNYRELGFDGNRYAILAPLEQDKINLMVGNMNCMNYIYSNFIHGHKTKRYYLGKDLDVIIVGIKSYDINPYEVSEMNVLLRWADIIFEKEDKLLKDPEQLNNILIGNDFYSNTWRSFRYTRLR